MGIPLRVLIVEASVDDADRVVRLLRQAGYDPMSERVQTAEAMKTALARKSWDLVVSDYSMPQFGAPAALNLVNESGLDIPFIVVSGNIGEEIAVAMMRTGVHDCILKEHLTRFVPAVQRELREAENRRQRRLAEQETLRLQVERDDLLERLRGESEDLAALTQVTANAIGTLDIDERLRVLLGRVVEVMRADAATILLADGAGLRVRASAGAVAGAVDLTDSTAAVPLGEGFAGAVTAGNASVYVEDATVDPLVTTPLLRERGIRSMLGTPIKRSNMPVGVLYLAWLAVRPCRDRDVHLLEVTAERCATAIQCAQLDQDPPARTAGLEQPFEQGTRTPRESNANLKPSERRFQNLFEYAPDALVMTNAQGIITLVNQQCERFFGWTRAELIGQPVEVLMPTRNRKDHPGLRARYLQSPVPRAMGGAVSNLWGVRKDGSEFPVDISLNLIDAEGDGTVVAAVRDLSDRKRSEKALAASEERYRQLVEGASEVFYQVRTPDDPLRGELVFVSQAALRITGRDPEQFIRDPAMWVKSVHPDDFPALAKSTRDSLSGLTSLTRHYRIQHVDGTYRTVEDRITPVVDAEDKAIGYRGVARDVTERHRLEAELQQSQRMESIGRLAGGIAHDFNNLVAVILGTVDLALADRPDEDPLSADLREVRRAGERAARLTRQLLAFSRRQILQPRALDLNSVLPETLDMLQRLIGEDITVTLKLAQDLGLVSADPGQIDQVIMNLVVNARDAMPSGGMLTIETQDVVLDEAYAAEHPSMQPGPHVMLAISDTGIGMDPATLGQIFEPFFTSKGPGQGTGLGLSTVYGIVKQSGGSIWAYTEIGRGSTFKVFLPRTEATLREFEPVQAVTEARGSETILVVEDEDALRRLATRMLESAGFTVLAAATGEEALRLLEHHDGSVHLAVTDVVMPGLSGPDLARRISSRFPEVRVLFTSGYTDDAIVRHGLLTEGTHFLSKPYSVSELTRKVREVLDS
jgi:PAS domain S-box-containing protein